jgi:hypothetical protein
MFVIQNITDSSGLLNFFRECVGDGETVHINIVNNNLCVIISVCRFKKNYLKNEINF